MNTTAYPPRPHTIAPAKKYQPSHHDHLNTVSHPKALPSPKSPQLHHLLRQS